MGKDLPVVECIFNLFHEGREYTGQHRNYVLENAQKICTSPATIEKIKLREALGYYGHGRRILAKKMDLEEVETISMPDGSKMLISNIPSNVTISFSVGDDGTVSHTQEILVANDTGVIVAGLNKNKIGGFSWACPGRDGGSVGATRLTGFAGFDYVLNPGFAMNRGYVLESAGENAVDIDMILESISKSTGVDNKKVEALFYGWSAQSHIMLEALESQLEEAEIYESALLDKMTERERLAMGVDEQLKVANASLEEANASLEKEKVDRLALVSFIAEASPFFIPEEIQHSMMENDFETARPIFESAKKIDFSQLPIGEKTKEKEIEGGEKPSREYGASGTSWDL